MSAVLERLLPATLSCEFIFFSECALSQGLATYSTFHLSRRCLSLMKRVRLLMLSRANSNFRLGKEFLFHLLKRVHFARLPHKLGQS